MKENILNTETWVDKMTMSKHGRLLIIKGQFCKAVLMIMVCAGLISASAQDFKRQYKDARDFYSEGKYNLAMESFKPLMVYDRANVYVEYASLYYSLSAYQLKYYAVAKETLLQVKALYPSWDQMDEVNYWLAAIYFKEGEYFQAMRMLYAMKSPRDLEGIERMKNSYLLQIYDEEVVRLILEEFPGETTLLKRQITRYVARGNYEKARTLIETNGLNEKDFDFPVTKQTMLKDQYRVAALFPFMMPTLEPSPGMKRNQSTLDLYTGMRFAVDSLTKLGVNIDLVSYDTERNPELVKSLMEQEEMKSIDVIVGPLFADEVSPVAAVSNAIGVPVINPVSSSQDFLKEGLNTLLYQPDIAVIGIRAAETLAAQNIKKPCVVIVGESKKDSILAAMFNKRAAELSLKVVLTRYVTRAASTDVYTTLADPVKFDKFRNPIEFKIRKDSIGSVFVASDDELIITKVISSIDRRGDNVIIIGHESWIEKPSMDLDKFERLHILLAAPTYIDMTHPDYATFRNRFASRTGVIPSAIARTGFECMMFIGNGLKQWGTGFLEAIKQGEAMNVALGRTFQYSENRCNKVVPFVTFQDGVLKMLPN